MDNIDEAIRVIIITYSLMSVFLVYCILKEKKECKVFLILVWIFVIPFAIGVIFKVSIINVVMMAEVICLLGVGGLEVLTRSVK